MYVEIKSLCTTATCQDFYLGILILNAYSWGREAYLLSFPFKFNEIKFSTLLMNWLIWEKNVHLFLL